MKICILGAGKVGKALGLQWVKAGHNVTFGVRDPGSPASPAFAAVTTISEAASDSEAILLSVPSKSIEAVLKSLPALTGQVLLDCSNPQHPMQHVSGLPELSMAESIAQWKPEAKVVKIFNTVGFEVLANPNFDGVRATMFYCCDDAEAALIAATLATDAGFEPQLAGGLKSAMMLENLTSLWGALAYGQKLGRGLAVKLLVRPE